MCGIIGLVIKDRKKTFYKPEIDIFKQLLYADAVRGFDSTGVLAVRASKAVTIAKEAATPLRFFDMIKPHEWCWNNIVMVGHNRASTRGASTQENAHPFHEDHISLVHNGTLRYHRYMKNVVVDSHAICHSIAEKGAIPTLEKLDGAFALVWWDEKTNELYVTRNKERPMTIIETDNYFVLSSEKGLAQWILNRNDVPIRKTTSITPGILYTFKTSKKNQTIIEQTKYKLLPEYKPQLPAPYVPPAKTGSVINMYQNVPDTPLKIGETVKLLCYKSKKNNYSSYNLGHISWEVDCLEFPDYIFDLVTDNTEDFTDMEVTAKIERIFFSNIAGTPVVVCSNPSVEKKSGNGNHIVSNNGLHITPEIIEQCKDNLCLFCSAPFVADPKISLVPVIKNGHVYKYQYHCPECTDLINEQKAFIGRMH